MGVILEDFEDDESVPSMSQANDEEKPDNAEGEEGEGEAAPAKGGKKTGAKAKAKPKAKNKGKDKTTNQEHVQSRTTWEVQQDRWLQCQALRTDVAEDEPEEDEGLRQLQILQECNCSR